MCISRWLILATVAGVVVAGSACTQKAADQTTTVTDTALDNTKEGADNALDATREGAATVIDETRDAGEKTADATRNVAQQTADKTKELAGKTADKTTEIARAVGNKSKEIVSTTGEVITDSWITTRVSGKFVDETLLKGSNINVDTDDGVVTLKGPVGSNAAKARAAAIAADTDGVRRVVNQLVVR